jgi:glutathione S-transferase
MLTLCGFAASNYYNKVKLALLEKGLPFAEEQMFPSPAEEYLQLTPMGKVPFLKTASGHVSESQVIVEYLEEACGGRPLYPREPMQRAKCRELIQVMELYLEWQARRLYPAAYFGGSASEETRREVSAGLCRGVRALGRLTAFESFAFGEELTHADCAALVHLPLVADASRIVLGEDVLAGLPGWAAYFDRLRERPAVRRTNADRKAGLSAFMAYRAAKAAQSAANKSQ